MRFLFRPRLCGPSCPRSSAGQGRGCSLKEPVSLDLFPDDVLPSAFELLRLRACRDRFFIALQELRNPNSLLFAFSFCITEARLSLEALGGLGGVW